MRHYLLSSLGNSSVKTNEGVGPSNLQLSVSGKNIMSFSNCYLSQLAYSCTYQNRDEVPRLSSCNHKIHPNSYRLHSQHNEKGPHTRLRLLSEKKKTIITK